MHKITDDEISKIGETLNGTCKEIYHALESLGMEHIDWAEDNVEGRLLDVEVERCVQCEWWHSVCELMFVEEHDGGLCQQCCDSEGLVFE
jgi:hypothetical protein